MCVLNVVMRAVPRSRRVGDWCLAHHDLLMNVGDGTLQYNKEVCF